MKIKTIAVKEFRELIKERTVLLGMIVGPIMIFAILSTVSLGAVKQVQEQIAAPPRIAIVITSPNPDNTDVASFIASRLNADLYMGAVDEDELIRKYDSIVYITSDAIENMTMGLKAHIRVLAKVKTLSFLTISTVQNVIAVLENAVHEYIAENVRQVYPQASASFLSNPLAVETMLYYKGRVMSEAEAMSTVLGTGFAVTIATLILVMASMQIAATSMGIEREAKTLEILLTLPIEGRDLVLGKVLGVSAITLLGILSYVAGMSVYLYSISRLASAPTGEEVSVGFTGGITITPQSVVYIAVSTVLALIVALAIGFLAGILSQDVRGAQLASSYIGLAMMLPLFGVFFGLDLTGVTGPIRALLYLSPMTFLYYTVWGSIIGEPSIITLGLLGLVVHLAIWVTVSSRLMRSEEVIYGELGSKIRRILAKRRLQH
ncbi:MAG: ABC transporter permease subunit [Desulfurococcales archaeon]|nr:ABC transporter permease subunit [Desulfurococcales archaeon]